MKASLVSATSLAALLAFEAGPALAGPTFDLSVSNAQSSCSNAASPSTCTLNFFALPGQASTTQTVVMTATKLVTGTQTFNAAPAGGFTGAQIQHNVGLTKGQTFSSNPYGYTGAATATSSGQSSAVTGSTTATTGAPPQTSTLSFTGTTVAPIQSVSNTNAGVVLVTKSSTATVTVANTGHGNKATGGAASSLSNLNGSISGASSNGFSGAGSSSISLADTSSSAFTYVYAPTVRGASSVTVTETFTNGKSDGTNAAQTVNSVITGTGVAPVLGKVSGSDAGFVLVKDNTGSNTVTVANTGDGNKSGLGSISNLNGTLGAGSGMFSGGAHTVSITDTNSASFTYQFAPTQIGASSTSVSANFSNGSSDGKNQAVSTSAVISGTGVAPVQSVSSTAGPLFVLVGNSATATVTVTNTGNGNLDTSVAKSISNLNGAIGAGGSVFAGTGGTLSNPGPESGLRDGQSQSATYVFTPTSRATSPSSQNITTTFTNGSADGKNLASTVTSSLTGQGVAPKDDGVVGSNAGFVLVKTSSAAVSVTVTNGGNGNLSGLGSVSNLNGTLQTPTGSAQFSGGTYAVSQKDGVAQGYGYVFAPTVRGADSATVTANMINGSPDDLNKAHTASALLQGQGVAPVNQVSSVSPVYARIGGASAGASVIIKNTGDGNLATGGPSSISNLNGSAGGISGTNWSGAGGGFSIQDNSVAAGPNSQTFGYQYTPQATRGSSSAGSVSIGFANGSSDGMNNSQTASVTLTGNTVGPVYKSAWPTAGTDNTPGKNAGTPTSTVNFGTVSALGPHTTQMLLLNVTTDGPLGSSTLTDLSIESFTITGSDAANFSIAGSQSGTGTQGGITADIIHKGQQEFVAITFDAKGVADSYSAVLTLFTDEDVDFGAAGGNFYVYSLAALVAAPEPASMLLLSIGIGGVLVVRRRRKTH